MTNVHRPDLRLFAARQSPITRPQRVCVIGLGYIGLPTSAVLADAGHQVIGVDVCHQVIETINRGEVHICEPGLSDLVARVVRQGRLRATSSPVEADVFMICVPTPITGSKAPELRHVRQAAEVIARCVNAENLIILESTSPPATTTELARWAIPDGLVVGQDVFVAYCPERVIPGRVLEEMRLNDRVVGGLTDACTQRAAEFYETFVDGNVIRTRTIEAELIKLFENAYRDVNIAFANELSMIAEQFDADAAEIIEIANRHPRVNILQPGPGVGGHCISVDPWFLVHHAEKSTRLISAARRVNDAKPAFVVEQIKRVIASSSAKTVGCLGLAYKADVDDLRQSPSLEVVRSLREQCDVRVLICEPYIDSVSFEELSLSELDAVLDASDVLVLLTDHQCFRQIPVARLEGKSIVDPRGIWKARIADEPSARRDLSQAAVDLDRRRAA